MPKRSNFHENGDLGQPCSSSNFAKNKQHRENRPRQSAETDPLYQEPFSDLESSKQGTLKTVNAAHTRILEDILDECWMVTKIGLRDGVGQLHSQFRCFRWCCETVPLSISRDTAFFVEKMIQENWRTNLGQTLDNLGRIQQLMSQHQ